MRAAKGIEDMERSSDYDSRKYSQKGVCADSDTCGCVLSNQSQSKYLKAESSMELEVKKV